MDKKKHDLTSDELKRLLELASEQEKLVDELSDEQLAEQEEALSEALKERFATSSFESEAPSVEEIDASWKKFSQNLESKKKTINLASERKKRSIWRAPYMGALAAAALALALVYLLPQTPEQPMGEINYKGQLQPGELVCDHRIMLRDGSETIFSPSREQVLEDGRFLVKKQESVLASVRCPQAADFNLFVHVQLITKDGVVIASSRNLSLDHSKWGMFPEREKWFLSVSEGYLQIFLTSQKISDEIVLPQDAQQQIGDVFVQQSHSYHLVLNR